MSDEYGNRYIFTSMHLLVFYRLFFDSLQCDASRRLLRSTCSAVLPHRQRHQARCSEQRWLDSASLCCHRCPPVWRVASFVMWPVTAHPLPAIVSGGQRLLFELLIDSHRPFDPDAPDAQVVHCSYNPEPLHFHARTLIFVFTHLTIEMCRATHAYISPQHMVPPPPSYCFFACSVC